MWEGRVELYLSSISGLDGGKGGGLRMLSPELSQGGVRQRGGHDPVGVLQGADAIGFGGGAVLVPLFVNIGNHNIKLLIFDVLY